MSAGNADHWPEGPRASTALMTAAVLVALIAGCGEDPWSGGPPELLRHPQAPSDAGAALGSAGFAWTLGCNNQFRGKAVLVTFIYDHCPDVCPLTVEYLREAQARLGSKARDLQIIGVSVDPRGDTPKSVQTFLREHRMTGRMEYLLGSRPQLEKVWQAWNILAKPSPKHASPRSDRTLRRRSTGSARAARSPRSTLMTSSPTRLFMTSRDPCLALVPPTLRPRLSLWAD